MSYKFLKSSEYRIPYAEMLDFQSRGVLEISVSKAHAAEFSMRGNSPSNRAVLWSYRFWNIGALAVLCLSIYWSFVSSWWWFIPGIVLFFVVARANQSGNAQNFLESAMNDRDFYEEICSGGGWVYRVQESDMDKLEQYRVA